MGILVDIKKRLGSFSLDISFESGAKRIGILGPSGCGKSLTLRSIAGIERPDSGRIAIDDKFADSFCKAPEDNMAADVSSISCRVLFDNKAKTDMKPQKRRVGYMFQNYALFPSMTVAQNIGAGLHAEKRRTNKQRRSSAKGAVPSEGGATFLKERKEAKVREMIRRFSLEGLKDHYPSQLSGGQQQRVALARIMAYQPDLILLDEPFSALDQHLKERLQHEMAELLLDYDGQVIMVSHSRDEIYRFAEELIVMDDGRILAHGRTHDLFENPGTVRVAKITGCKNFSAAKRIDAHRMHLTDWGIDLYLEREIPEDITAIGYRAHYFVPIWSGMSGESAEVFAPENCLPCRIAGVDELPFERRYYISVAEQGNGSSFHIAGTDAPEPVCWFVQESERRKIDRNRVPDWLRLEEDSVLLLK